MRLNKRSGNKSLVTAGRAFSLTGNAATLTKSGGTSYPAVVTSLGIEHVYDLQTSGTGPRSTPTKIPGVNTLPSGATYSSSSHRVLLAGSGGTFSGWDLRSVRAYVEITQPGWTVSDNLITPFNASDYCIKLSLTNGSTTIIEYNELRGDVSGGNVAVGIGVNGIASLSKCNGWIARRNYIHDMQGDNFATAGDDFEITENYCAVPGNGPTAHGDHIQHYNGSRMHVHLNYFDMTPNATCHGRTNSWRLETNNGGSSASMVIADGLFEKNICNGGSTVDVDNVVQFYLTHVTGVGTMSGNRFENNVCDYGGATVYNPTSTGLSGTGNRKLSDNSLISNFSL